MSNSEAIDLQSVTLTQKVVERVAGNWLHNFEIDADKRIITPENYSFRRRVLEAFFSSHFVDRSVLVFDEASGLYPTLIHKGGARSVTASSANQRTCELIQEVTKFLDAPAEVLNSKMIGFYEGEPYVDMEHGGRFEFLLALGQIWPMFGASDGDFDAIVEACAFFVTHGLVFDWTDAVWASPPPPAEYNLDAFLDALRRKFEFVTAFDNWLIVASGKLPVDAPHDVSVQTARPLRRRFAPDDKATYDEFVPRFRELVRQAVPEGLTALVVSKGDPDLVKVEGRTSWHFPSNTDGEYAGYHPSSSEAAIEHLEELRAKGAHYFVLPKPSFWWMDHYSDLFEYLDRRFSRVAVDDAACVVFDLEREMQGGTTP